LAPQLGSKNTEHIMEDQTCIPQNFNYHRKIGQTYVWYAQLEHGYSMLCEMMQYQFVKKH
jgi:hypothetical protein